jgi:hypothetical protein
MTATIVPLHVMSDQAAALAEIIAGWPRDKAAQEWRRLVARCREVKLPDHHIDEAWLFHIIARSKLDTTADMADVADAAMGFLRGEA